MLKFPVMVCTLFPSQAMQSTWGIHECLARCLKFGVKDSLGAMLFLFSTHVTVVWLLEEVLDDLGFSGRIE